jgi:hypothetical protein
MKKYKIYLLYPILMIIGYSLTIWIEGFYPSQIASGLPFYLVYLPLCSIYVGRKSRSKIMFDFPLSIIATLSLLILMASQGYFTIDFTYPYIIQFLLVFISSFKYFRSEKSLYQRIKNFRRSRYEHQYEDEKE